MVCRLVDSGLSSRGGTSQVPDAPAALVLDPANTRWAERNCLTYLPDLSAPARPGLAWPTWPWVLRLRLKTQTQDSVSKSASA